MSFNLSNPTPLKSNDKKVPWYEKIWAGISLIALFGEGMMPKGAKDNLPVKARNIIILIFIFILLYLIGSGVFYNGMLIIKATGSISFSLGDYFYYYGIIAIMFIAASYFNIDNALLDHANKNNMIKEVLKDMGKKAPDIKLLGKAVKSTSINTLPSIIGFLNTVWVIWGIIFYDRWLFISLLGISLLFSIVVSPIRDMKQVKMILILEMVVTILLLSFILINHFITF